VHTTNPATSDSATIQRDLAVRQEQVMPSPFPGIDPYLEGELWQEFHETLAGAIRAQLMLRLAPKYVALLAKRNTLDRPALGVVDTPAVELPGFLDLPQLSVEIRDVAERRLVTVIEILSPANKYGDGAREYLDRRTDLLRTETHLLELDLLRQGARIPLVGEPPPAPYYVYLGRWQRRPFTQVWPVALRERLPVVPVPLLPPDPDVPLDLQAAVAACFDLVGYERLLPYAGPPPPPELSVEDRAWVDATLREAALRGE
jgi:hypothetical protein